MSKYVKAWEILGPKVANKVTHEVVYEDEKGNITVLSKGTSAWRNSNPGNVAAGAFADRHGAIGSAQGHAVFPDIETAEKAKDALLKNNYADITINDAFKKKYSPEGKANPHDSDYVNFISKRFGVSPDTKIGSLNADQYNRLYTGIDIFEGTKVGDTAKFSSGSKEGDRLREERALTQPVDKLSDNDINRLMAGNSYLNSNAPLHNKIQDLVRQWHVRKYGDKHSDSGMDATGRMIRGAGNSSGGDVQVSAYDRVEKGKDQHVGAYTRARPQKSGSSENA